MLDVFMDEKGNDSVEYGVVRPVDHRASADATLQHLASVRQGFFGFVHTVYEQGFPIGHICEPSSLMTLTMGDDRSGEFSNSSRVKIRGEITMKFSKPTSHAAS